MPIGSNPSYVPSAQTATALIKVGPGVLGKISIASTSSGTFAVYDSATAATTNKIIDTTTPAAAQVLSYDAAFANGLYIVVTGTLSYTVLYV